MALEGKRPVAFESQGGAERSEEIPIKETQPLGDPLWFISPAVGVKPIRVGGNQKVMLFGKWKKRTVQIFGLMPS